MIIILLLLFICKQNNEIMETKKYVEQGQYSIINKREGSLATSGLATCSAISFIINDIDIFMAHIDAKTDVNIIANHIKTKYAEPIDYTHVKIWYGDGICGASSEITQKLIAKLANLLGISIIPIKEDYIDIISHFKQNIIECKLCKSKSGTMKIITHNFNCRYNFKILIRTVGFMETVHSH